MNPLWLAPFYDPSGFLNFIAMIILGVIIALSVAYPLGYLVYLLLKYDDKEREKRNH